MGKKAYTRGDSAPLPLQVDPQAPPGGGVIPGNGMPLQNKGEIDITLGTETLPGSRIEAPDEEFFEFANINFTLPSPLEVLEPRTIVVLNASALDDEQRDYMLKVVADELLWFAKHKISITRIKMIIFSLSKLLIKFNSR